MTVQPVEVVVRAARPSDLPARAQLVRETLAELTFDAFLLFFFQELTLQCVVLCGAVLFIFLGAPVSACAFLPLAAAAIVWLGVKLSHHAAAEKLEQNMRTELLGYVAELHAPLLLEGARAPPLNIRYQADTFDATQEALRFCQLIGTVSVEEAWSGRGEGGRLRGLCVSRGWRRRGAGAALLSAAARAARTAALPALAAAPTQLHDAARELLSTHGWECRGAYQRQLLGTALTLQVALFALDLTIPEPTLAGSKNVQK